MNSPGDPKRSPAAASAVFLTIVTFAAGSAALVLFYPWRPLQRTNASAPVVPLPPVTQSVYLNTAADAKYVGSKRCQECHTDEHDSYSHTAHSRSFSRVEPDNEPSDGEFDHALSGSRFRAYRAEGKLRHRESLSLANGEDLELVDLPLAYLVGSGRYSRTYLAEVDGFLVESPLTWYASLNSWGMSPGYDQPSHPSFRRNIGFDCLYCHTGDVVREGKSDHRLRVKELAIGCERCHGPGSLHVARHRGHGLTNTSGEQDFSIVNPRRLPRDLAEAVCQQCHLETASAALVRGRRREEFRPGLAWNDFCINYAVENSSGEMTVTGHVEQLRHSRCYQADDSLSCLSCHDPHNSPDSAEQLSYYRAKCLKCHQDEACNLDLAVRKDRNDNDCAACHMPRGATDIAHVAFTHHRIGIFTQPASSQPAAELANLAPVLNTSHLPESEQQRLSALAYLRLILDHQQDAEHRKYVPRAMQFADAAARGGASDSNLLAARFLLMNMSGEGERALASAREALNDDGLSPAHRAAVSGLVAKILLRQSQRAEAMELLRQLVALRRDPGDWFLLGLCRQSAQDRPGAIDAFERARKIDPREPETYQMLAPLYRAQGHSANEQRCLQMAERLKAPLPIPGESKN